MPLTDKEVRAASPVYTPTAGPNKGKTITGNPRKLSDGNGLYLWVFADGAKYWRFKSVVAGKESLVALGVYPDVPLASARKQAQALREQAATAAATGVNLSLARAEERRAKKNAEENTFEAVSNEWYGKHAPTWSSTHKLDVRRRLDANLLPYLGKRPVSDITPPEVLEVIQKIEKRGATDLAHRVLGVAGQVLRYGVATHRCISDPTRDLRGALTPHVKRNQHAVPEKSLPQLLLDISSYDAAPINGERQTKLALQLLALTFVRTNELIAAPKAEFDLNAAMWSIPGERMKGGRDHMVPLASQAVRVIKELVVLSGDSPWLLPGRNPAKPISNNTLLFALYRLGYRGKMTGHGFRAVASTKLNESNLFDSDWIERQLAHVPENQVRSAYNRALYLPQRIRMMQWWADYLDTALAVTAASP